MKLPVKIHNPLRKEPKERGFAMVVTVTMLVLLSLLSLGVLSLSLTEVRSTAQSNAQFEARANARLALMMALGQLQKTLGPDQRVSAPSSLLDNNPETAKIDGVRNPQWVRVWKTQQDDGTPFIQRAQEDGGLRDLRVSNQWDAEDDTYAILVSGQEILTGNKTEEDDLADMEMTTLVGAGTLGEDAPEELLVHAPLIEITDPILDQSPSDSSGNEASSTKPSGAYAWWVGDLNTKANIATPDSFEGLAGSVQQLRRVQLAQDASLAAMKDAEDIGNQTRSRLLSNKQLEISQNKDTEDIGHYFHDFTTRSQSVFANAREGGLMKDLTAYLLGSGVISGDDESEGLAQLGVSDSDNLIGPRNGEEARLLPDGEEADRLEQVSPTFALLRNWANRSSDHRLGNISVAAQGPETRPAEPDIRTYGGQNRLPAKYFQKSRSDFSPVLVEGSTYYNISSYETGLPSPREWGLRLHLYPRVALWNPYNFDLEVPPSMIALQVNGGKKVEVSFTPAATILIPQRFGPPKQIEISHTRYTMSWGNLKNQNGSMQRYRRGSLYFRLEGVTIEPGETVVFAPRGNTQYSETFFDRNLLSPNLPPSPTRSFFLDERSDGDPLFEVESPVFPEPQGVFYDNHVVAEPSEWREYFEPQPLGDVQAAGYTQADDYYMYWKPLNGSSGSNITLDSFSSLPHGQFVSCAYQYGDEDELPVVWSESFPVPVPNSSGTGAIGEVPDRRTRDGFRLRWFNEHPSNRNGGGSLAGTPHLESSLIGNWNVRSSYSFRSPFENVSDVAPHYFSGYTRDLFDGDVSWEGMSPSQRSGKNVGDPFNPPVVSTPRRVLFDVPRSETGIQSLGAFQHVKFSEFTWHPTFAFGNSLADPRMPLDRTEPRRDSSLNSRQGGWNKDSIGWSNDGRSNSNGGGVSNQENWAHHARGLLEENVEDNTVQFDLSFELNHSLWDRYFLSTGSRREKNAFMSDSVANPLPNGRLRVFDQQAARPERDILDFHRAASVLTSDGGFNVNSTSETAWEAVLLSTINTQYGGQKVAFPRILDAPLGEYDGHSAEASEAWAGTRVLDRDEVKRLATEIVREVKTRGPFLSMSDFVNRKLTIGEEGLKGCLQAAIDRAGINEEFELSFPLDNGRSLPSFNHSDNIEEPTRIEQTYKPATTAWGALGFLTQADLLQSLGHNFFVRSDSFIIRGYGESRGKDGKVASTAWCEAVVARTPVPVNPDDSGLNPQVIKGAPDFGRRFEIQSFRWLSKEEV
ncbi:hypothetical protein [Roseibacillus persicicus]|uniref:hypothetical protein n=1 Tax=Roseibacillus persicicus TaxID=454148 RepID=UPI00280F63AB|nr:hypothetical protein [Roseibacillus persicicus]MDQ8190614.1 hypothetical protein [Roseibacillus persicicus]